MLYTVSQLAKELGRSEETIRRWCREGKVNCKISSRKEGYIVEYNPVNKEKGAPDNRSPKEIDKKTEDQFCDIMLRFALSDYIMYKASFEEVKRLATLIIE